jgi:hypothetical protein
MSEFTIDELSAAAEHGSSVSEVVNEAARRLAETLAGGYAPSEVTIPAAVRAGKRPHSIEVELDLADDELELLEEEAARQRCALEALVHHGVLLHLANPTGPPLKLVDAGGGSSRTSRLV